MKKSSEVLGLKVIGIKEGAEKGVAQDFMVDASSKLAKYLIIKTGSEYIYRMILVSDVVSMGADYVTTLTAENIKDVYASNELLEELKNGFFLLGATVLSSSGNLMAAVEDFSFDEKTGQIEKLYLNDGSEIDGSAITTLADKIVFVETDGAQAAAFEPAAEPVATESFAEVTVDAPVEAEVIAPVVEAVPEPVVEEVVAEAAPAAEEAPARSALEEESIAFLLGKTVMSEVVSDDGLFRVEEGTVLTEDIIDQAEQHDAILTLTLSV